VATSEHDNSVSEPMPARERLLRGLLNTSALAALLLIVAAFVGPAEHALQLTGLTRAADAATPADSEPAEGISKLAEIAIPLPKPKRFEAAPETGESLPYAWRVDSGSVYRDSAEAASTTAAEPARSTPDAGQASTGDDEPTTVYGHGGW
jgi:hypothetical protein